MKARFGFSLAAICASFLVACGGGGGGGGGSTLPVTTPTPSTTPSGNPTVGVTFTTQPSSAAIPSGSGVTGTISLPAGSGSAVITASSVNPKAATALAGNLTVGYFTLTAQGGPVTMQGLPGFTATVPSTASKGPYFVAFYDTSGVVAAWESTTQTGGNTDANHSVTVPNTTSPTITVANGASIYLAVYYGSYIPPYNATGCVGASETPLAARTQSLAGVHPITSGNSFQYSGTLTDTLVRSSPCPVPTTTAQATVSVNVVETTAPAATPAGATSDEHSVETDAFSTKTQQVTTDAYVGSNGSAFYELGETSTDQGGNSVVTSYGAPGLQFAMTPEGSANQWTSSAPHSVVSTLTDGSTYTRTFNPNGTYSESDSLPGGLSSTITENADGSGSYSIGAGAGSQFVVGLTAPSAGKITMTYAGKAHTVPAWYGSSLTAYSDSTQDFGVANIDAACGSLSPVGSPAQAEKIVRTTTIVDAILGYTDTRTTTTWDQGPAAAPVGPICVEISDVEKLYYDYSLDTTYYVYRTSDGSPIQTNTITETYALNAAPVANIVRRATQSANSFRGQVAARQAGIDFARSVERAKRSSIFVRSFQNGRQGGRQ